MIVTIQLLNYHKDKSWYGEYQADFISFNELLIFILWFSTIVQVISKTLSWPVLVKFSFVLILNKKTIFISGNKSSIFHSTILTIVLKYNNICQSSSVNFNNLDINCINYTVKCQIQKESMKSWKATIGFGLIGKDKPFPDTVKKVYRN